MSATNRVIRLDKKGGGVAEVVLANGDRLNVMSPAFFDQWAEAFAAVEADPEIRAVLVRAEGRMFTAGLDLKSAASNLLAPGPAGGSPALANLALYRHVRELQAKLGAPAACSRPVVAAVHGLCIGGGIDLITSCDIRLCEAAAQFAVQETKIAIVADLGTLQRLARITGEGAARRMALTGARIDAERALRWGLVSEVYPDPAALLEAARAMAAEIAVNSPVVVQGVKAVMNHAMDHTVEEGLEFVAQWNAAYLKTNDLGEAVKAWFEKRPPKFEGR